MNEQGVDASGTFEAWIGLYYDRNIDGGSSDDGDTSNPNSVKWRWTDKNPVTYTSWGKNQPQPNSNAKGCVVIDGKGGWTVTDTCDAAKGDFHIFGKSIFSGSRSLMHRYSENILHRLSFLKI